jgi:ubiquinone/menaquinone biosynthesis C-methylase UbiE
MNEVEKYYALVEKAFNILAPFYNLVTFPIADVRKKVVGFANVGSGSRILDVATGTGQQAFAFAKRGHHVIGVDLTEAMLKVARRNNGKELVEFEIADATRLSFEDNGFDVTCVSFAFHDMPMTIREKVWMEIVRVTKINGTILIIDYALPHNKIYKTLVYRLVSLYEGEYYKEFIATDLDAFVERDGTEIIGKLSILHGAGRILKVMKIR